MLQIHAQRASGVTGQSCSIGDKVDCPGDPHGTTCMGDQCCPPGAVGKSFPCPSARPDFGQGKCELAEKVTNCVEEKPPECNPGLPDRCTNPKGPPCPAHSSCHPASGYCVCKQGFCGESGQCVAPQPECNRGLQDRCTNPKGPPCPAHSTCHPASGYCVCKQGFCGESGQCVVPCPAEELQKNPQSCTNPKGPPCPPGSRCHPASGYCVC